MGFSAHVVQRPHLSFTTLNFDHDYDYDYNYDHDHDLGGGLGWDSEWDCARGAAWDFPFPGPPLHRFAFTFKF